MKLFILLLAVIAAQAAPHLAGSHCHVCTDSIDNDGCQATKACQGSCYTTVLFDDDELYISKGCVETSVCTPFEDTNVPDCYNADDEFNGECTYCCTGAGCNKELPTFGRQGHTFAQREAEQLKDDVPSIPDPDPVVVQATTQATVAVVTTQAPAAVVTTQAPAAVVTSQASTQDPVTTGQTSHPTSHPKPTSHGHTSHPHHHTSHPKPDPVVGRRRRAIVDPDAVVVVADPAAVVSSLAPTQDPVTAGQTSHPKHPTSHPKPASHGHTSHPHPDHHGHTSHPKPDPIVG